jgi:hypothetical protein
MNPEKVTDTTLRFINSWKTSDKRLESELLSLHNETFRKPDQYSFKITPKGLVDPISQKLVKEFILQTTPLQRQEYKVFSQLEAWSLNADGGIMLWLSPACNEYPCAKAIFSRIVYNMEGKKNLANSAVLFGNEATDCLDIIPHLNQQNADIRIQLFYIEENDEDLLSQIIWNIERYTDINLQQKSKKDLKQAKVFAKMIEQGINPNKIVIEMQKLGFLGTHPVSCPTFASATDTMLLNSRVFSFVNYEFKPGICRVCHQHTHVGPCCVCKECERKFS